MTQSFDSLVVGGGMSGLPLALRAARHERVALVERELLGGTCLNRGCIPTKTMITTADAAHGARNAAELGIVIGSPEVDLSKVIDRKNEIVESIRAGSYDAVRSRDSLSFFEGTGSFTGRHMLQVGDVTIEFDKLFLNTGTRDSLGGIVGLEETPHLTSRTILDLRDLPEHLVVVGGGFIGCEFAQMFRRFGSRVTIVQRGERLLPTEDIDISAAVLEGFVADGIDVRLSTSCIEVSESDGAVRLTCGDGAAAPIEGSHLLVATGRLPNSDDMGIEHLGLALTDHGYIEVDDQLRATGTDDVWVLGDLRGGEMFTHTARDDADVVYRNVYRDGDRTIAGRVVPHAVFVDPEVGSVGLTEQAARLAGHDVMIGVQRFDGVAKAIAMGQTNGLVKFVVDQATDLILGCHIAGPHAGDLIHEAALAMVSGATYGDIGRMIHVHPTLAEGVNGAAGGIHRPSTSRD